MVLVGSLVIYANKLKVVYFDVLFLRMYFNMFVYTAITLILIS